MRRINDNFFQQNGGRILRQRLTELNISPPTFRIFTAEELELATDGYSEIRVIGEASNGCSTVYKGIIYDRIVAIKRCCHVNEPRVKQFISELVTLSMLPDDKHIVRLLGACCDDTPVPVVVYEYVPNRTLYHHLHELHGSGLSWEARLRIAAKTAEALACLHSALPDPQFHRGVSAKDILLDEGMEPKVSDFGARLVKVGCLVGSKIMKDREGYWDPMFVKISGRPTEKGDVYGFGVVIAELLTGELAMSEELGALGKRFREGVMEGMLVEMLDGRVREEVLGIKGKEVETVAELARRCLMVRVEERPTMREVAEELQDLMKSEKTGTAEKMAAPPS